MLKLFHNKKKNNNKGFTLVELVVVVAILAILVGILSPQYTKYVERSRQSADASNLDSLVTGLKVATADGAYDIPADTYTITIDKDKTTVTGTGDNTAATEVKAALDEYSGGWSATTLKSKKWSTIPITAECIVDTNGSVTVTYTPKEVKNSISGN